MITTIHHNLPTVTAKRVVKSFIGSLNATAIAYARGHLRFNAIENGSTATEERGYKRPVHADEKHIDDFNDAQNAIDESEHRNSVVAHDMGFEVQMQSGELAERIILMRNWFAMWLEDHASVGGRDQPLTIADTIKFQISSPQSKNDELLEALAAATELDADELKAAQIEMVNDDVSDLKRNAGKVLTYLEAFRGSDFDERDIEQSFNALPAHVQYKLMSAAIRAHEKAVKKSVMELLRGKLDAAGDVKMLKGHREELLTWLVTFSKARRVQLDAYMERGGSLMEIEDRTVVTSNTKPATQAGLDMAKANKPAAETPQAPMAPIGSCDVTPREPKVIGAPRRGKKATA